MRFLLVDTDNFGGDYPNEKFVKADSVGENGRYHTTKIEAEAEVYFNKDVAKEYANKINKHWGEMASRYIKVVVEGYKLEPGFEP